MRIGFNLLLWTTHVTAEYFPLLSDLKSTGYDGVEIPIFEGDRSHFRSLRQAIAREGLASTAVTVVPPDANPISPEAGIRAKAVDRLKWSIDMAAECGAELLCGPFHSPLAVFTGTGPTADEKKWAADVLRTAAEYAATANVLLTIEFLNRFECYFLNTAADTVALVKAVAHPSFQAMYDTFHANIEEKQASAAIRTLAPVLRHVHISENDRGTPGTGHVEWAEIFVTLREIGYDGWLTVEAFGRALPDLAAATRVWRDLFPPDEPWKKGLEFTKSKWEAARQ